MGLYNTYAGVQLKISYKLDCKDFKWNDEVDLRDGVYVGYEGVGKLRATFPGIVNKWGGLVLAQELIDSNNPITEALSKNNR